MSFDPRAEVGDKFDVYIGFDEGIADGFQELVDGGSIDGGDFGEILEGRIDPTAEIGENHARQKGAREEVCATT